MTKSEYGTVMHRLAECYGRLFNLTANKMEVWETELIDLDYDTCIKAIRTLVRDNEYPPTIADIYKTYDALKPKQFSVEQSFNRVTCYYPCGNRDKNAKAVYETLMLGCADKQEREDEILTNLLEYVKECERGDLTLIPYSEWLANLRFGR